MARSINRLTTRSVSAASKPGLYSDGAGLNLRVTPSGTKGWVFRYMLDGKSRTMGLGPIHDVSLAEARSVAHNCRLALREGVDPIDQRAAKRNEIRLQRTGVRTFRECAEAYLVAHRSGWKNAKHAAQWEATLRTYAYPVLGDLPVEAVDTN